MSVYRFCTWDTKLSCLGDGPIYSPILALVLHFDIIPPACRGYECHRLYIQRHDSTLAWDLSLIL